MIKKQVSFVNEYSVGLGKKKKKKLNPTNADPPKKDKRPSFSSINDSFDILMDLNNAFGQTKRSSIDTKTQTSPTPE